VPHNPLEGQYSLQIPPHWTRLWALELAVLDLQMLEALSAYFWHSGFPPPRHILPLKKALRTLRLNQIPLL
ncbi:uncharacterized, partial [Tachysurus ichikawai]